MVVGQGRVWGFNTNRLWVSLGVSHAWALNAESAGVNSF